MNFQEQQPETFSITPQEPMAVEPFMFQEGEPEDMNAMMQARNDRRMQAMERVQMTDMAEDIREPFKFDVERITGELETSESDAEIERLENEIASLRSQMEAMERARGPRGFTGEKGDRGPAGKSIDADKVAADILKKVSKKIPTTKDFLKMIAPLIPEPKQGKRGVDGKDGRDGSPDTPEQIKEKIVSLDGHWFDWKHLKNIPAEIFKTETEGWVGGYGALDFDLKTVTLAQITSNQNDYALGYGSFFRISSDAARTITGIEGGKEGRGIVLVNVGSFDITIANQSGSSGAINRIITGTSADIVLSSNEAAILFYDNVTERWRVQNAGGGGVGAWSTPAETPDGSNTVFTVDATAPTDVVADGINYYSGAGYTFAGGQITFDLAPSQFVRYR